MEKLTSEQSDMLCSMLTYCEETFDSYTARMAKPLCLDHEKFETLFDELAKIIRK